MQLFLIRHGESANNALGVGDISYEDYMAQRSPDPGLTQIGKRQAEMVARHLAADGHPESRNGTPLASTRAGYGIQTLYVSAMLRALQTARPIAAALGLAPQVMVDIHEHGCCARLGDGLRCRYPARGRRDHLVSGTDAQHLQGDVDRVRSVGYRNTMLDTARCGEFDREPIDEFATDERRAIDDRVQRGVELLPMGEVLRVQVDERYLHGHGRQSFLINRAGLPA